MSKREQFTHKLIDRLDRVDQKLVQNYVLELTEENSIYGKILDELAEGVILMDSEKRIQLINRQAANWIGSPEMAVPRNYLSECIADSELRDYILLQSSALNDRKVSDLNILLPKEISLRIFLIPLELFSENNILILLAARVGKDGQAMGDDFIARIESLVNLAAGIAHEIGNPLNAISIHLELLRKQVNALPSRQRATLEKPLQVLNDETLRLDQIVRNFLKVTRKAPLRFYEVDLNKVIDTAIEFMRPQLEEMNISIRSRQDHELTPFLMDANRLHQALINLIKNAQEAMPNGGILFIGISHKGSIAIIRIKDEGEGIPEEVLPHIFDVYYTTKKNGSGLGLMTVYNAVREHGGRIEVSSKTGKGSTFTLLLPIRKQRLQLPNIKKNKGPR